MLAIACYATSYSSYLILFYSYYWVVLVTIVSVLLIKLAMLLSTIISLY
jgi:hypothetical protein